MTHTVPDVTLLLLLNALLGVSVIFLVALLSVAIWKELSSRRKDSIRTARNRVLRMFVSERGIALEEEGEQPDERTMHRHARKPPESTGVRGI